MRAGTLHRVLAPSLSLLCLVILAAGCNKAPASAGGQETAAGAGMAAFQKYGCRRCHSLAGTGGSRAPDLSHVASDPTHTKGWIMEQIRNPASHNPSTRMPAYGNRIPDADLQALASYLAGLK
ncbi:MAG: c-type cytochrome [Chthonomonadales bacterium]